MNVILVTTDSVFGRYVAASLHQAGSVDRLVIETGKPAWSFYWRKLKRVGPANAVFQFGLSRWFEREGKRHLPDLALPPHEIVATVNDHPFHHDDLVIGFGSSIIKRATLARMKQGFLNLHTGWLPDYRGVKSEFWTLAHGDHAKAGWTLHYMSPRLDEGDIVLQRAVPVDGESPPQLRAKLLRDAVPALIDFIDSARRQGFAAIPRKAQVGGRYFTTPTWGEWRTYRRRARPTPAT